jgi:ABC-type transport system involved in multi-copper enzyme maturation permease subunit
MWRTLVWKEARELLSSTKFATTFTVSAVLILLTFYAGARNHQLAVAQQEASVAENRRQLSGLTDWLALEQYRIFLPPSPLEALVTGISSDIGRTAEVRSRGEISPEDSRFNEDPIFAVFRFLDLSFIFQVVLSLFAILLGYDAICGEKERGTLRLTFANAVPRATYISAKLAGSLFTLSAALLSSMLAGCLLLPVLGVTLNAEEWLRLAAIMLAGLLYFSAFLALSVFVSTLTHRTSSAFLTLLVIWIATTLVVPASAVLLAGRAVAVPSIDEVSSQKASFARGLSRDFADEMKSFQSPEGTAPEDVGALMAAFQRFSDSLSTIRNEKLKEFNGRLNEDRSNRQRVQERYALGLARVSPTASLTLAMTALAGTSLELKNRFYDEAEAYRTKFNDFIREKTGVNVSGSMMIWRTSDEEGEAPGAIDPAELPVFNYRPVSLADSFAKAQFDLALLALFNLLFFAGAFAAFLRYDLR